MSKSLIEVNGISKTFKISKRSKGIPSMALNLFHPKYEYKKAVKDISFRINEGEMVGFIGPNGAGKSTTIKMLSGILYPDSGHININGFVPYKQRKEYVSNIGVVLGQKSQLSWDLPVIDSFELIKHIYRIPDKKYEENLEKFTELLNMSDFINQPVRQLSLGQRMRADIVAALLHSPKIVFFDEPTIGLDVVGKEKIRDFIRYLNETQGITMIFTTHDMQDIEKTCNRLIIIDKGDKLYDGNLIDIREKYGTSRQLDIQFESNINISPIEHVKVEQLDGLKKRFIFENTKVHIHELMSDLLTKYKVKDLSITEPDIETIIRQIYEGSIDIV
jgi:ABC-2 type transport system ATP-binding protein